MSTECCVVAADTKLETPEGPLTLRALAKTPASVLTRLPDGTIRFAMLYDIRSAGGPRPVLRITLETGKSFRVGLEQVLIGKGGREILAYQLKPNDELEPVYTFPEGYAFRTDAGEEKVSTGSIRVLEVSEAGDAEVFSFRLSRADRFMFSAGVLGKCGTAAGSPSP